MTSEFIHLHLHSQYSLLDGAIRFEEAFEKAASMGMTAVALTDHGNMFGAVEFYQTAQKRGLKPIVGCEVYVAPGSRHERKAAETGESSFHLTLLAMDRTGYYNLVKLVSLGNLEGFYYKPRVDKEILALYNEGLIALSGCMKGEVAVQAGRGEMRRAVESAREYERIFDRKRFFLELQSNGVENQDRLNERLQEIGRETGIPPVATNDCHYLESKDARAHEVLLCIQTGKTLQDSDRMHFSSTEFYFKSPAEMAERFRVCPEAVVNTLEIGERCNLDLRFEEKHIPRITIPTGEPPEVYFDRLAREGLGRRLRERFGEEGAEREAGPYRARLDEELKIITSLGFPGYFLIVADFIRFAKDKGIPVGPGRGSAAGSLVAYALRITDLDPLEHDLIFERFLNPGRKNSMPDVDVDFCEKHRDEVIRYVTEKYGKENVAQIITFGKMQARAVIRDVGRVMGLSYADVDKVAKLIPPTLNITLKKALEQEPALNELRKKDPKIDALFDVAASLEGLARHASTHAAGVVIANKPLMEYLPLYRGPNGEVITQYTMKDVEKIGLVKFDFLGLTTLTVVDHALRLIETHRGIRIEPRQIPMDDPKTYALLASGSNLGIFQLESSGMRDLLVRLRPENIKEITALLALYRPGPLESGMVDQFIKRKHGREAIKYDLPALEEILKDTYGVILYQEQVMRIASTLASFTLEDADNLRRAMGKKDANEMARHKETFLRGTEKNRINPKKAEKVFDQMAEFAKYGFNKSHSAAYALLTVQTAWLKTNYPIEFMTAMLTSEAQNADKIVRYIAECRDMGIPILPPDINESFRDFTVSGESIRFGLAAVKNVGDSAIEAVISDREEKGRFRSLFDFCYRVDLKKVNRRVIESLIKCGAFDFSGVYRSRMLTVLDELMERAQKTQRQRGEAQMSMFLAAPGNEPEEYPDVEEFPEKQLSAFEKETIGLYVSKHPLMPYQREIERLTGEDTSTLPNLSNGSEVRICGVVSDLKEIITKKGDRMAFMTLEDMKGGVEVILFPEVFKNALPLIRGGDPILVRGTLDISDDQAKTKVKIKGIEVRALPEPGTGNGKTLHLSLPLSCLDGSRLEGLRRILMAHRGPNRVVLHLTADPARETVIALPEDFAVDASVPLQEDVSHLLNYPAQISVE